MAGTGIDDILKLLCSHVKLERDRGVSSLEKLLSEKPEGLSNQAELESSLASLVQSTDSEWETRHGGLLGAKLVVLTGKASESFMEIMKKGAFVLMHDDEFRVRILSGNIAL